MTTLIVPACGKSSRFGEGRPKPYRTHPLGEPMLIEAMKGITGFDRLVIGVIAEHITTYGVDLDALKLTIGKHHGITPEFVMLNQSAGSQPGDCYQIIKSANITGAICIKDCDNYFKHHIAPNKNFVCISRLKGDTNAINKSYVSLDKNGKLLGIVEKMVIGDLFCCGGYGFQDADEFCSVYEKVLAIGSINSGELYISHIIQDMLLNGSDFDVEDANDYVDWGDNEVWRRYCSQYKTMFVDIDGCLCVNGSEYFEPKWETSDGLTNNIALVNEMFDSGTVQVILTTSRKSEYKEATKQQLTRLGIKYHSIIYDLFHAQRMIVNDFSEGNPYPSAVAFSVDRNADCLRQYIDIGFRRYNDQ